MEPAREPEPEGRCGPAEHAGAPAGPAEEQGAEASEGEGGEGPEKACCIKASPALEELPGPEAEPELQKAREEAEGACAEEEAAEPPGCREEGGGGAERCAAPPAGEGGEEEGPERAAAPAVEEAAQDTQEPPCVERPGLHHWRPRRRWRSAATALLRWRGRRQREGAEAGGGLLLSDPLPVGEDGDPAAADDDNVWLLVDRGGLAPIMESGRGMGDEATSSSVEAKVEHLLTWMLAPAVHGIPKLGVPGSVARAEELLSEHGRDVEAAVREVVAGSERTVSTLVLDFCLERIPVLGCPTVLLRSTWGALRSVLIIAALYGHDLEAPRVQHEALLCLVPPSEGGKEGEAAVQPQGAGPLCSQASLVGETAQRVARTMIRGALRRATGLQAAVDCFELASLLYSSCGQDAPDEDGFVHVLETPASAARGFFRRRSLASRALLWGSLPLLLLGSVAPGLLALADAALALAAALGSARGALARRGLEPRPAPALAALALLCALRAALRFWGLGLGCGRCLGRARRGARRAQEALEEAWPQIVTTLVFTLHAILPAASMYSSVSMVLVAWGTPALGAGGWAPLHRLAGVALGLFGLCSTLLRGLQAEAAEAEDPGAVLGGAVRAVHFAAAAMRGCCVLAAWTYASLALDLGASWAARLLGACAEPEATALGVVGPLAWLFGADAAVSPLRNERALAFCLNLVSVTSQQRLVEMLGRREVLLRLIGAERVMASSLCLLLKGVAVACSNATSANPIAEFLTRVAPPRWCVVPVLAVRSQALALGAMLRLAPPLLCSGLLNTAAAFALGSMAGVQVCAVTLHVWHSSRAELDSPALRLALLIPGSVSTRAKGLLHGVLAGARTRAVQMVAMSLLQRITRWCWRPCR